MPHLTPFPQAEASGERRALMDTVRSRFGAVINMFGTVAHSPCALEFMLAGFDALGRSRIGAALGEQIAVAIANRNDCEYCLSAHTALGRKAGLSGHDMEAARQGCASDPRAQAALDFAVLMVERRGHVGDAEIARLRAAGFDEEEIVEIVAHVALNIFTNYVNVAFDVDVDFPRVKPAAA
jgi:uncharacterized peroxidase-related enzyme